MNTEYNPTEEFEVKEEVKKAKLKPFAIVSISVAITAIVLIGIFLLTQQKQVYEPSVSTEEQEEGLGSEINEKSLINTDTPIFTKSLDDILGKSIKHILTFSISPNESTLVAYASVEDRSVYELAVSLNTGQIKILPTAIGSGYPNFPQWINNLYLRFIGGKLVIHNFDTGEDTNFSPSDYLESKFSFGEMNISPNGEWIANSYQSYNNEQLEFLNIKDKKIRSLPQEGGSITSTWFSDSKRILGCKNNTFTSWDIETGEQKKFPVIIPENQYSKFSNCSTDVLWIVPDKLASASFSGEDEGGQAYFIVDFDTLKVTDIPYTSFIVIDPKLRLAISIGNKDWHDYSASSVSHVTVYDENGNVIGEKVFDQTNDILVSRYPVYIINNSHVFYLRTTSKPHDYFGELVLLDLKTGNEQVVATTENGNNNIKGFSNVKLLSDKKTWIATAGNQFYTGKLNY